MVDGEGGRERGVRMGSAVLTTLDNFHMYTCAPCLMFIQFRMMAMINDKFKIMISNISTVNKKRFTNVTN